MKPSASRIERMLAKIEARLVPPPRKWLSAIIDDIDCSGYYRLRVSGDWAALWGVLAYTRHDRSNGGSTIFHVDSGQQRPAMRRSVNAPNVQCD
jgi:hypothetical protein